MRRGGYIKRRVGFRRKPLSRLAKRKADPNSPFWKRKADALWAEHIHRTWPGCLVGLLDPAEAPACKGRLEAHHLISRRVLHLRHTKECGVRLCSWHHEFSPRCSPHSGPLGFAAWLEAHAPMLFAWLKMHNWSHGTHNFKEAADSLEAELKMEAV